MSENMSKSCVICGDQESESQLLVNAPCDRHFVCPDDIATFFENATSNESLFPPKCCGQVFLLAEYEDYVPFDISWSYQMKEQGEYAILTKYRIYCANPPCAKFLHPTTHIADPDTNTSYAICENENCFKLTCCSCKTLIEDGTQNHTCYQDEHEKQFKEAATKKGYQECFVCGATVELAEACNHITCDCGHQFCYICGKDWSGRHGCPNWGPAFYDEEGYNQEGYHRETGLNRNGLTRRQEFARQRGEAEEANEEEDPEWDVLQHIDAAQRVIINQLPPHEREDALDNMRIQLHDQEGIIFGQGQAQNDGDEEDDEDDENGDEEDEDNEDNEDEESAASDDEDLPPLVRASDDIENEESGSENEGEDEEPHDTDGTVDNEVAAPQDNQTAAAFFANERRAAMALAAEVNLVLGEQVGEHNHGAHGAEEAEDRDSSSSPSEEVHPPTPMDIDDPSRGEGPKETEQLDGNQGQAPEWYE